MGKTAAKSADAFDLSSETTRKVVSPCFLEALSNVSEPVLITESSTVNGDNVVDNVMFCNRAFVNFSGITPEEICGHDMGKVLGNFAIKLIKSASEPDDGTRGSYEIALSANLKYKMDWMISESNPKTIRKIFFVRTNVAESRPHRDAVEVNIGKATKPQKLRFSRKMLSDLSHEIRTPLNAIIGFSELMQSEVLGSVQNSRYRSYLQDIVVSGRDLLSTLGSILELTRYDSGFGSADADLSESIRIVLIDIAQKSGEDNLASEIHGFDEPVMVRLDQVVLERILSWVVGFMWRIAGNHGGLDIACLNNGSNGRVTLSLGLTSPMLTKSGRARHPEPSRTFTCNDEENSFNLFLARRFLKVIGGHLEVLKEEDGVIKGMLIHLPAAESAEHGIHELEGENA